MARVVCVRARNMLFYLPSSSPSLAPPAPSAQLLCARAQNTCMSFALRFLR